MDSKPIEKIDRLVSVVAVLRNQASEVEPFIRGVHAHLNEYFTDFEIVLIDQASTDKTPKVVEGLLNTVSGIRLIQLARRVDWDVAFAAGIENAIGDFVIIMEAGRDPENCVAELVTGSMKSGTDVIHGVSLKPVGTFAYRMAQPAFSWILKSLIGYSTYSGSTGLLCLSRRAVNSITETNRFHQTFPFRVARTGYETVTFRYTPKDHHVSNTVPTLMEGFRDTLRMLVFNSTRPLRWMSGLGILGSLIGFIFALYTIVINVFMEKVQEGWTSLALIISTQTGLMFILLAFLGEYIGRLLSERGTTSEYNVVSEKHSSVMLKEERFNVLVESTEKHPNLVQTGRDR